MSALLVRITWFTWPTLTVLISIPSEIVRLLWLLTWVIALLHLKSGLLYTLINLLGILDPLEHFNSFGALLIASSIDRLPRAKFSSTSQNYQLPSEHNERRSRTIELYLICCLHFVYCSDSILRPISMPYSTSLNCCHYLISTVWLL